MSLMKSGSNHFKGIEIYLNFNSTHEKIHFKVEKWVEGGDHF